MNSRKIPFFILALLLSCTEKTNLNKSSNASAAQKTEQGSSKTAKEKPIDISKEETIQKANSKIIGIFKTKKYEDLALYFHPEKGVTFSMYANIKPNEDKRFTKSEFLYYLPSDTKFTWGIKDGMGDLYIDKTYNYLNTWVWNKDYTKATYELNGKISRGNSLENVSKIFPGSEVAVNFVKGTSEYNEMDWGTLAFVFEKFQGMYYLVAIVNDRWTS